MSKLMVRTAVSGVLLIALSALPALSQPIVIPAGDDYWATPAGGGTQFTFPAGEVEALCGGDPSIPWDHSVSLQGEPITAQWNYDTVVSRLDPVAVTADQPGETRIQVTGLSFRGVSPKTPCGPINWSVGLSGQQPITTMVIHQNSARGGIFNAPLAMEVEFRAHDASNNYFGSLFYTVHLPDPSNGTGSGTPWSLDPANGRFRAGMDELDKCIAVLRQKLAQLGSNPEHFYYISDLIARRQCP